MGVGLSVYIVAMRTERDGLDKLEGEGAVNSLAMAKGLKTGAVNETAALVLLNTTGADDVYIILVPEKMGKDFFNKCIFHDY